tara:strand:- start:51 stop:704 length:654 start_codon:yes stop_codon:yes gene_type:complete
MNNILNKDFLISKGVDPILANILIIHSNDKWDNLLEFITLNRDNLGETILNVGMSNDDCSHSWANFFLNVLGFKKLVVLEYHEPNYDAIVEKFKENENVKVIHGDVRAASTLIDENVDCSFWWHGPEHIPLEDLPKALQELDTISNKAILWACPWGSYYPALDRGWKGYYEGDAHHYYPENNHFTDLGMNVVNTGGNKNTGNANVFAWKFLKKEESV